MRPEPDRSERPARSGRRSRTIARAAVALACLLLLAPRAARAAAGDLEAKVKAAYIFNFLTFVEWEPVGAGTESGPVRIHVLGDDPVYGLLKELSHQRVRGRALDVQSSRDLADVSGCHLLVISRSELGKLREALSRVQGKGVLTVSDIPGFSREGGMIGFVKEGGRVRLEINPRAAAQAGLKISAKLLELARIVP